MGWRDALNRNPAITTGATAGIIVVALAAIVWTTFDGNRSTPGTAPSPTTTRSAVSAAAR